MIANSIIAALRAAIMEFEVQPEGITAFSAVILQPFGRQNVENALMAFRRRQTRERQGIRA